MMNWLWYDKSLGPRGYGAWFFAAGTGVFAWAVYLFISLIYSRNLTVMVTSIFSLCAIFSMVMTVFGLIYIGRTARTAQRICIVDGEYRVHCYLFGKVINFAPSNVLEIQNVSLNPYFNIPTFMSRKDTNFRVYLENSHNFYLNGAVEGTAQMVSEIKRAMTGAYQNKNIS